MRMKRLGFAVIVTIIALVALALHARYYFPFIADDALISLRYAQRLAAGQGLTWNNGEWVEGYSNLLWVLCAAALKWLGVDLITAVRALGVVSTISAIAAIVYAHLPRTVLNATLLVIALLFLVLSAPIAVWSIGGMEQPVVAGLLAWAVVLCDRVLGKSARGIAALLLPGCLLALLSITRLDGVIFTWALIVALFLIEGLSVKSLIRAIALGFLPLIFVAGQLVLRLAYYGEWVPNTALVKFVPSSTHSVGGFAYLRDGAIAISPLIIAACVSAVISLKRNFRRSSTILILCPLVVWAAYVVLIGGDIFPAWRHFVPLIVLLAMLTATGAQWVGQFATRFAQLSVVIASLGLLLIFTTLQFRDSENFRAKSERWEWDGQVIGTLLKKAFGAQQPLMAIDPAGCLPYWSELPSLDMLGLNDYYLPRHPPSDLGQGPIGHELGDGKYVLDRHPDLVIFLLPTGNDRGYFLSGRQMQQEPRFHRDYTLVWFEGREPYAIRSRIWVRKESERIGIKRDGDRIHVPGFLLNGNPGTITYLDSSGSLVVPATKSTPARVTGLTVAPGRWRVEVDSSSAALEMRVRDEKMDATATHPMQNGAFLDLSQRTTDTTLVIDLAPVSDGAVEIRSITLLRESQSPKE